MVFGGKRECFSAVWPIILFSGAVFGIFGAADLPGLTPGREGKREGLKVGTILSKIVPEVARGDACLASCLSARDLLQPFEKIVPDF